MSTHAQMFDALVLQHTPRSVIERMMRRHGKHRTQRLPRNGLNTNLFGLSLPRAWANPTVLATLRTSNGSQAVHSARREAA